MGLSNTNILGEGISTTPVDLSRSWDTSRITAIIPVRIDSVERLRNLQTVLRFIKNEYGCPVMVTESDTKQKITTGSVPEISSPNVQYQFVPSSGECFHRTRFLNDMLLRVTTPYVANWDCDILVCSNTMKEVCFLLEQGYDLVYPYCRGAILRNTINPSLVTDIVRTPTSNKMAKSDPTTISPVGNQWLASKGIKGVATTGCLQVFRVQSYINGYGENEEFVDYGPEDYERFFRFHVLGYKIAWLPSESNTKCRMLHLPHPKSPVAGDTKNRHYVQNHQIWERIRTKISNRDSMIRYMEAKQYWRRFANRMTTKQ
jgi:hypothetical protein